MTFNFGDAFKKGIGNAEITARLNAEIDHVVTEVSRQIYDATDSQITISIDSRTNGIAAIANMFSVKGESVLKKTNFIVARNMKSGLSEDLAVWERSPTAYPCKIIYSDQTAYCSDKSSLEKQFLELLSHPDTGKKMLRLLTPFVTVSRNEGQPGISEE